MVWRPRRKLRELEERIEALEAQRTWELAPRPEIPSVEFDTTDLWSSGVALYASPWGGYEDEWRPHGYL